MKHSITRQDYTNGTHTHAEYYSQFVTQSTLDYVTHAVGINRLLASTDEHLNDISLAIWDRYYPVMQMNGSGGTSLSDAVCVAKQAARQIIAGFRSDI